MPDFRAFTRNEVYQAQRLLQSLLTVRDSESCEEVVPQLRIRCLVDNTQEQKRDWCFLDDPRNSDEIVNVSEWFLKRGFAHDWLRDEFIKVRPTGVKEKVNWVYNAAQQYYLELNRFLELLLLLVRKISGQPARGTELTTLRYRKTIHVHRRNVFVEDGFMSTVTAYYKGYSVTGSTRIIHRYLLNEIGEMLMYYLWLIRPFEEQLYALALPGNPKERSLYIWSKRDCCEPWDSAQLGRMIKREGKVNLKTEMTIMIYQHTASAISGAFLPSGRFKKDYDVDDAKSQESAHSGWTAGTIYARGLEEAPGHIAARRAEFRATSREWHDFLGFKEYLPSRKRVLEENYECGNGGRRRIE